MSKCGHIEGLLKHRFLFVGELMSTSGQSSMLWRSTIMLYQLTTNKSGRMYRSQNDTWMEVKFCPECGEAVEKGGEIADDVEARIG